MRLLRRSLPLLLLTAGFSLGAAVPQPSFGPATQYSGGGSTTVRIIGSKAAPKIVNGVDSGKDTVSPLSLSGNANTWDVVTADHDAKNILIRVQAAGGGANYTFVNVPTTGSPTDLAIAAVCNKTTDDLITAEDGVIRLYKNTRDPATPGNPTFDAPVTLTATATDNSTLHINKIAVADFNQDGQPDIVGVGTVVINGQNQIQVAVFLSDSISPGVPSFQAATVYTQTSYALTGDLVAVGNLDSDLYPEIVVGGANGDNGNNGSGSGSYTVFYNKGNGTFGNDQDATVPPAVHFIFDHPHALAIGDANGDGHRDIIIEASNVNNGQTQLQVHGGNATGTFGSNFEGASFVGTNTSHTFQGDIVVGDLNGDGITDLATILDTDGVHVYGFPSNPDDGPNSPGPNGNIIHLAGGTTSRGLALTDANRDGSFDLAVATADAKPLTLFLNTRAGAITTTPPSKPTFTPAAPQYGQLVSVSSTYATTVAGTKLTFQRKGVDNKWVAFGSAVTGVQGTFTVKSAVLPTGVYTFRAGVTVNKKVVYSDESDPLTIGLATPVLTGITPASGRLPVRISVTEPGVPGSITASGLTFKLQSSMDGSAFTDVTGVTITGTNGKYVISAASVPTDAPYFRVIAQLGNNTDITSPNFSLYAVDATIAMVTNDTTAADDGTQIVKTAAALGANVINADGTKQTKTVRIAWGDFQTYAVRFKNTSRFFEALSLNGPGGTTDFEVRYFAASGTSTIPLIGADITSTVTTSGYVDTLQPGAIGVIYVRARTFPGTARATVLNVPITAIVGGDTTRRDTVKLAVSATNAVKAVFVTTGGPSGPGSLLEAINYANLHPGTTIEFDVPSDDAHWDVYNGKPLLKIPCTTPMPIITAAGTAIDATSQRELPDQVYSGTNPAICLVGYGIPDTSINVSLPTEVGLDIEAANCSVQGLMVTRFATGISFYSKKAVNGSVFGCTFIGNLHYGVSIENQATKNTVGGPSTGQRNVFRPLQENNTDYSLYGVGIVNHASNNKVQGNFIGVREDGSPEPANSVGFTSAGVFIGFSSEGNLIGGTTTNTGNLISGNYGTNQSFSTGIEIHSSNNIVQGNFIGTNLAGNAPQGNNIGIFITVGDDGNGNPLVTDGNVIGSTEPTGSNLISGNQIGIKATSGVEHTKIYGNFIGTSTNGQAAVPNTIGIRMHGYDSTIGGKTLAYRNVISGNLDDGILLDFDQTASNFGANEIYGNFIGVNSTNTGPLGNGGNGVEIFSGGNTVGDSVTGEGNIIANNTGAGVLLLGASNLANTVRANLTHHNGGLPIDIVADDGHGTTGVTPNDSNEADGFQNFPVLTGATKVANKNTYKLSGSLQSLPNQTYVLDSYLTDTPNASGHGDAKVYLGSIKLKADAQGHILFAIDLPIPAAGLPASGKYVSMTATQLVTQNRVTFFSGTSEFSANVPLP